MWNCAYQIYPRTIKVVSILSKFIFLDLKTCFFEKTGLQRNIVYRVHIGDIAQYRVHIARILKKNIAQAWSLAANSVPSSTPPKNDLVRATAML